jgi:chromosome segregation ATPase
VMCCACAGLVGPFFNCYFVDPMGMYWGMQAAERDKAAALEAGGEEYRTQLAGLQQQVEGARSEVAEQEAVVAAKQEELMKATAAAAAAAAAAADAQAALSAELQEVKSKADARKEKMKAEMLRAKEHIEAQQRAFKQLQVG